MSTATTTGSADFYALESLLDDEEQDFLHRVRDFMKSEVEPSVNRHWQRGSFPFEVGGRKQSRAAEECEPRWQHPSISHRHQIGDPRAGL